LKRAASPDLAVSIFTIIFDLHGGDFSAGGVSGFGEEHSENGRGNTRLWRYTPPSQGAAQAVRAARLFGWLKRTSPHQTWKKRKPRLALGIFGSERREGGMRDAGGRGVAQVTTHTRTHAHKQSGLVRRCLCRREAAARCTAEPRGGLALFYGASFFEGEGGGGYYCGDACGSGGAMVVHTAA
jgi:hypothetical protein